MMSAELARSLFSYDRETGALTWLVSPRIGVKAGWVAGGLNAEGYRIVGYRGQEYMATSIIWLLVTGEWPQETVDHKSRDVSDDRWDNLRAATYQQNNRNMGLRRDNPTGARGVSIDRRRGKYRPRLVVDGREVWLGYHNTLEAAVAARQTAEIKHFGAFSPLMNQESIYG